MKIPNIQALYALLVRLSRREKLIFYVALSFLSLTVLDRLIINPIFSRLILLDKEIQEKETAIKRNLHILAQKDRILAESSKYSSFFGGGPQEEMTSILKEIEGLANKNSVYLIDMKPAGLKSAGSFNKYLISLSCEAQMEQIISFIYNIENSNLLLAIEKFQLSPKSKESSVVQCSMSIAKIVMP